MLSCSEIKLSIVILVVVLSIRAAFCMPMPLPSQDNFRRHVWNETGQLAAAFGNEYCGYYAYDAQGNRAYKITGYVVEDKHNAGYQSYTAYFDNATMYVNPYMVVTPQGYTKHYYNGSQRIASRLGDYWNLEDPSVDAEDELATADSLWLHTITIIEPDHQDMEGDYQYIQADGSNLPIVSYGPYISSIRGFHAEDILWGVFSGSCRADDDGMTDDGVFYYHPDHLGSATWITSDRGQVVQYLHYMPFGELWESQQASEYNERFKFTGKERDAETGYDYFGARYYLSLLGIWLSPDPLLDEYPELSSYAYCRWNPLKYIDPNGLSTHTNEDGAVVAVYDDNDLNIYRHSNEKLASWGDVYENRLTTDDADIMGQSLHAFSFADQNLYNKSGVVKHANGMTINFGSTALGDEVMSIINSNPSLIQYALNARGGHKWDLKSQYKNQGSQLLNNVYASPRDAGNFLAGAIKGKSGILAPVIQFGYGAYNMSGNRIVPTALMTIGTCALTLQNPMLGAGVATRIMNGEDLLTQLSINIGFNYMRK